MLAGLLGASAELGTAGLGDGPGTTGMEGCSSCAMLWLWPGAGLEHGASGIDGATVCWRALSWPPAAVSCVTGSTSSVTGPTSPAAIKQCSNHIR